MAWTGEIRKNLPPLIPRDDNERDREAPNENTPTPGEIADRNTKEKEILQKEADRLKQTKSGENDKTAPMKPSETSQPATSEKAVDTKQKPGENTTTPEAPVIPPSKDNTVSGQPPSETAGTARVDGRGNDHTSTSTSTSSTNTSSGQSSSGSASSSSSGEQKPAEPAKPAAEIKPTEAPKSTPDTPEAIKARRDDAARLRDNAVRDMFDIKGYGDTGSFQKHVGEYQKHQETINREQENLGRVQDEQGKQRGRDFTETADRIAGKNPAFKEAYEGYQQAQRDYKAESDRYADSNSHWSGVLWNGITGGSADRRLQASSSALDERRMAMTQAAESIPGLTEADKQSLRNSTLSEDSSINQQTIAVANNLAESYGQQAGDLGLLAAGSGAVAATAGVIIAAPVIATGASMVGGATTLGEAVVAAGGAIGATGVVGGLAAGAYDMARDVGKTAWTSLKTGDGLGETANRLGVGIDGDTGKTVDTGAQVGGLMGVGIATGNPYIAAIVPSVLGGHGVVQGYHNISASNSNIDGLKQGLENAISTGDTGSVKKIQRELADAEVERGLAGVDMGATALGTLWAGKLGKGPTPKQSTKTGPEGDRALNSVSGENHLTGPQSIQAELNGLSRAGRENTPNNSRNNITGSDTITPVTLEPGTPIRISPTSNGKGNHAISDTIIAPEKPRVGSNEPALLKKADERVTMDESRYDTSGVENTLRERLRAEFFAREPAPMGMSTIDAAIRAERNQGTVTRTREQLDTALRTLEQDAQRLGKPFDKDATYYDAFRKVSQEADAQMDFHRDTERSLMEGPNLKGKGPLDTLDAAAMQDISRAESHHRAAQEASEVVQAFQDFKMDSPHVRARNDRNLAHEEKLIQARQNEIRVREEIERQQTKDIREEGKRLQRERADKARQKEEEILRSQPPIPEEERIPTNE